MKHEVGSTMDLAPDWDWRAHYAPIKSRVAPGVPRAPVIVARPPQRARALTRYAEPIRVTRPSSIFPGKLYPVAIGPLPRDVLFVAVPVRSFKQIIAEEMVGAEPVTWADILSSSRVSVVVRLRHRIAWRLRQETTLSFQRIAEILGRTDHSTIWHAIRQHQKAIDTGRARP